MFRRATYWTSGAEATRVTVGQFRVSTEYDETMKR